MEPPARSAPHADGAPLGLHLGLPGAAARVPPKPLVEARAPPSSRGDRGERARDGLALSGPESSLEPPWVLLRAVLPPRRSPSSGPSFSPFFSACAISSCRLDSLRAHARKSSPAPRAVSGVPRALLAPPCADSGVLRPGLAGLAGLQDFMWISRAAGMKVRLQCGHGTSLAFGGGGEALLRGVRDSSCSPLAAAPRCVATDPARAVAEPSSSPSPQLFLRGLGLAKWPLPHVRR